jgi:glucan phosphoethanolaminetransferase (alkaline phosphatase superfamily)
MLWKLKMLNSRAAYVFVIFLGIWTFELYMDNYSSRVPLSMMGLIANIITVVFLIISIVILYRARKTTSIERKTILGGILYITLSIVLSASSQWKTPQSFYIKYGAAELEAQIGEMQKELDHINEIKKQMTYQKQ